jgi:hypothetical protein
MPTIYKTVDVDIDVSDLDEAEVVEACEAMGYSVIKMGKIADPDEMVNEMNNLAELYRNADPRLMEELRTFLQNYTNRVLP